MRLRVVPFGAQVSARAERRRAEQADRCGKGIHVVDEIGDDMCIACGADLEPSHLPPNPRAIVARHEAEHRMDVRRSAHKKLDEAFDLYFAGVPLAIQTDASWTAPGCYDRVRITIERYFG